MIVTTEQLQAVEDAVRNTVSLQSRLLADAAETMNDRASLLQELEQRERIIADVHRENRELQTRVDQLEAMLDSVRATVEMVKPNGAQTPQKPLLSLRRTLERDHGAPVPPPARDD